MACRLASGDLRGAACLSYGWGFLPAGPDTSSPPAAEHEVGGLPDADSSSISVCRWSRSWLLPNPGARPLPSRPARLPQHDARSLELRADGKVQMLDRPLPADGKFPQEGVMSRCSTRAITISQ